MTLYGSIYRRDESVRQLPFELKISMPSTDRGKRVYSDEYVAKMKLS